MGKHEREDVMLAEKNLTNLLNNKKTQKRFSKHKLYNCTKALYKRIKKDFPSVQKGKHIGNTYGSIGNIKITLTGGKEVYLELKFLSSGTGTRANIGQDSLTDLKLIASKNGKKGVAWSTFREERKHLRWVRKLLNKYKYYPKKIKEIKKGKKEIYQKALCLKKVIKVKKRNSAKVAREVLLQSKISSKKKKAAEIILEIIKRDRKEKLKYLNYLRGLKQNHKNIKKFLFLIMAGNHTKKLLEEKWSNTLPEIISTFKKDYYTYYVYKKSLGVEKEDHRKKLKNLINKKIFLSFPKKQTNVLICFKEDKKTTTLLRVVFHWKNKFQGIQTPCLNIFDGPYFK